MITFAYTCGINMDKNMYIYNKKQCQDINIFGIEPNIPKEQEKSRHYLNKQKKREVTITWISGDIASKFLVRWTQKGVFPGDSHVD